MSHFTTVKTQITDIAHLRAACAELGKEFLQDATARGYRENRIKADYVIHLDGPYDIAVQKQEDGTYGLTTDWYRGHVAKQVGEEYGKLLQLYEKHACTEQALAAGYTVDCQPQEDGSLLLAIEVP